jgi:exodeoxyribonuclease-3
MKIISYNINGIRAAIKKNVVDWIKSVDADVICLQEVKAEISQIDTGIFEQLGYQHIYWNPAVKKGYSGVAVLSRLPGSEVKYGIDNPKYDIEGRAVAIDIGDINILNVYMPSGSSGEERQQYKYEWLADFASYVENYRKSKPNLVICGDYNICHQAIDIHNPVSNKNSSGFLPEERAWMSSFLDSGFTDAFRHLDPSPHKYTWWSNRSGARQKNLGWRIDYHLVSEPLTDRLKRCVILDQVYFSDHCPVLLELK